MWLLVVTGSIHKKVTLMAHIDYFFMLRSILKERDNASNKANYFKINSIVYKYFLLGKKKFFQL